MRSLSNYYKQKIASGETRIFHVRIEMTLADGTVFDDGAGNEPAITDTDIMDGTFKLESASSGTSTFDIGAAVIGMCKFSLDNYDERWSQYDFFGAVASVWVKLDGDSAYERMGIYTVDEPQYAGAIVSLELLDNMYLFDVPMPSLSFPCTCQYALNTICNYCGVILASQTFHGYDFELTVAPDQEMNCREFLQYVAMIGCNFCVIDNQGRLVLRWYDTSAVPADSLDGGTFNTTTTPYSDGDSADGGDFLDYTNGDSFDGGSFAGNSDVVWFTRNFSATLGTDEITVTGIKININDEDVYVGITKVTSMPTPSYQIENEIVEYIGESTGSYTNGVFYKCVDSGDIVIGFIWEAINLQEYELVLENPLIGESNVVTAMNYIWDRLQGFKFRTFNVSSLPDITGELGDACAIKDLKGNTIISYISLISFAPTSMGVQFNAETPSRQLGYRMSKSVQTALEQAKKQTAGQISNYDVAVNRMNNLAVNAMGGYQDYDDVETGGRVYYLSNKPITHDVQTGLCVFDNTATVFKLSGDGFFVSFPVVPPATTRTWENGYSGGELVVNVLKTIGLSAEWIETGLLTIGGINYADTARLLVKDTQDVDVVRLNKDGIWAQLGTIGDVSLADGELYIAGNMQIKTKTYKTYKAANKYVSLIAFRPSNLFPRSPSVSIKVGYEFTDPTKYRNMTYVLEHNTSGTTYTVVESIPVTSTSGDSGYITFETALAGTDTSRWRVRAYNTDASSVTVTIRFTVDALGVHVVSIRDGGFYGKFLGALEGTAELTSASIGGVDIDNDSMDGNSDNWGLLINSTQIYTGTDSEIENGDYIDLESNSPRIHICEELSNYTREIDINATVNSRPNIFIRRDNNQYIDIRSSSLMLRRNSSKYIKLEIDSDLMPNLDIQGDTDAYILAYVDSSFHPHFTISGASDEYIKLDNDEVNLAQDTSNYMRLTYNGNFTAQQSGTPLTMSWDNGSDERLKEEIKDIDTKLAQEIIDKTEPKRFKYKASEGKHYGMMAQDVRKVLDSLGENDAVLEHGMGIDDYRMLDYKEYIPLLITYVKELKTELERVKTELNELKEDK